MTILLDGKSLSEKIITSLKDDIADLKIKPSLTVILVGDDKASEIYVKNKEKVSKKIGINSNVIRLPKDIDESELLKIIDKLNNDESINAILVQLPLPKHINSNNIIESIKPIKDVDGFHPYNIGKLSMGLVSYSIPCTPLGIINILQEYNIDLESKKVLIIGRSNIVGKPLFYLLLNKNATVTIAHSKTVNLKSLTLDSDIIISAIGKPKFITTDMIKQGSIIIDVGISRLDNGKISGDIDFENVKEKCKFITPVPGGVGPMTIAMLMKNTLHLYKLQNKY